MNPTLKGGNEEDKCVQFTHLNETYLLPPRSKFILSDMTFLDSLITGKNIFYVSLVKF